MHVISEKTLQSSELEFFTKTFSFAWSNIAPMLSESETQAHLMDVIRRYDEPHRQYHTLLRVITLLRVVNEHVGAKYFQEVGPIETSQFILLCAYHNLIYVPSACGNEALSALYLKDIAIESGTRMACVEPVLRGITAATHEFPRSRGLSQIEHLFRDACMLVFTAKDKVQYYHIVNQIADEYDAVGMNKKQFSAVRKVYLENILRQAHGTIFHTQYFTRYNDIAMRNITQELDLF